MSTDLTLTAYTPHNIYNRNIGFLNVPYYLNFMYLIVFFATVPGSYLSVLATSTVIFWQTETFLSNQPTNPT